MEEIVINTLSASCECLQEAEFMLNARFYKATVSRSYYSMFHTAKAALLSIGNEAYSHQGVRSQFSKHFVKAGIFDVSLSRAFNKILEDRILSDYEVGFKATKEDAEYAFNEAKSFYEIIKNHLEK